MKPRVIVGIDPGTTTAWAVLDIHGSLLQIGSSKELGINALISVISSFGKPLIAGTDKRNTPGLIQDFSRKCGSRTINPREDLSVRFKRELCQGYRFSNSHELDALASAIHAQRELRPLLLKIKTLKEREHIDLSIEEIFETVINSDLSIRDAIAMLSEEEIVSTTDDASAAPAKKTRSLISLLRATQREGAALREQIERITHELDIERSKTKSLESKKQIRSKTPVNRAINQKEHTITAITAQLNSARSEIGRLKKQIEHLEHALVHPDGQVLAHIMEDLTRSSLEEVRTIMKITTSSIIYVRHPNRLHRDVIDELERIQPVLLTDEVEIKHQLPFVSIKGINRTPLKTAFILLSSELSTRVESSNILHRVVADYQQERATIAPSEFLD